MLQRDYYNPEKMKVIDSLVILQRDGVKWGQSFYEIAYKTYDVKEQDLRLFSPTLQLKRARNTMLSEYSANIQWILKKQTANAHKMLKKIIYTNSANADC